MIIDDLLSILNPLNVKGSTNRKIHGISCDSRKVKSGDLLVAWKGERVGEMSRVVREAAEKGAAAIAVEEEIFGFQGTTTLIHAQDLRRKLSKLAARFYGNPDNALYLVGITGTNGKTTTAFLTQYLLNQIGLRSGLIGTVQYDLGDRILPASRTTPEGNDLYQMLAAIKKAGLKAAALEVSSHALAQGRVEDVDFDVAVFMNLTPDHLDYHGTMENYYQAKKSLFTALSQSTKLNRAAIINTDDPYGKRLAKELTDNKANYPIITFGFQQKSQSHFLASNHKFNTLGQTFSLQTPHGNHTVRLPYLGAYNAYNAMAALAATSLKASIEDLLEPLKQAPSIPGRMQTVSTSSNITVIVDYAHTPDAVEKALKTLRALNPTRLTIIIGCGGNRDRAKRPLMAQAAVHYADFALFTADNPRHENLSQILNDMAEGADKDQKTNYTIIPDRYEAIKQALTKALPGEIILIAGKGHETTQQIGSIFHPFNDLEVAREILNALPTK
jgi:UDP-N-acetylmuramoyl-L-alanyl-D-glutamate--2,6-diaminopimelate ligase